jgi:hypothetical protein
MEFLQPVFAWLEANNKWLEPLSYLATVIGVPILLLSYLASLVAESHRREVGTYDTLETQYVEFQKLALNNPILDVGDTSLAHPPELGEQDQTRQRTLYMVLFSLFERAYMLYKPSFPFGRGFSRTRRRQWRSWVSYFDKYLARQSCREAWFGGGRPRQDVGQDFDPKFEKFIWKRLKKKNLV